MATYPEKFAHLTLDDINYHLSIGIGSKAEAEQLVEWWNTSGKRFTVAKLIERAVYINGVELLAPHITISG